MLISAFFSLIMKTKMFEVICPNCQKAFMISAETIVNSQLEPNYVAMLKKASFFNRKCSNCGAIMKMNYPFIYYDPIQKVQLRYHVDIDGDNQIFINNQNQLIEYIKMLDDRISIQDIKSIKSLLDHRYPNNSYDGQDEQSYYFKIDDTTITINKKAS